MKPLPEESQPDFAIRFHTAMASEIPATNQRNLACLNAWRNSTNHKHLARSVDSRFPVSQYRRAKNVHYFEEHEVPEDTLPDGTKVPPKKYSRTELAEMVAGMNARIADHDHFPPLSKGHTVLDENGRLIQDPDVLGYTGPFYLGQVGDVNPRWGIFGDEYHAKDSIPELDRRRGRSPEVWPYRNARDRFFHPVAALGAEMPRGNLIPARYSRTSGDGEKVIVEFYTATAPFAGNTCVPAFGPAKEKKNMNQAPVPDQYGQAPAPPAPAPSAAPPAPAQQGMGDGDGDEANAPAIVEEIIQGLMETPPFQFLMQLYQERQQQDSQGPMDGGQQFAQQQASTPAAPPAPAAPAPAVPVAAPPMPPSIPRQYSRQVEELQRELARERHARQRVERYSRLNDLTSEFILDPDEELERTANYSDAQFEDHYNLIVNHYNRNPANVPDFHAASSFPEPKDGSKTSGKLSADELDEIGKIAQSKGIRYSDARDLYVRQKRSAVAVS